MSSKRLFSWSRRQSNAEPYYRTGGLLTIDDLNANEVSSGKEAKDTQKARRRPSNLTIIPPDHQQFTLSPLSSPNDAAIVSSTSNLMTIFNDILRSPTLSAAACPRSASVHKLQPTRPGSNSIPSTPDLPVELPGSLLQHNQGFPHLDTVDFAPSRPTSQNIRRGTHPLRRCAEDEGDIFDLLYLFPEPLNHSKSVPSMNLGYRESAMKSSRSGTASNSSAINKSNPHKVHHRKALSDIEWRTLADSKTVNESNVAVPPVPPIHGDPSNSSNMLGTDSGELSQPSLLIFEATASDSAFERRASRRNHPGAFTAPVAATTRNKQTEDLKVTVAAQNQTITTLQSQFGSLRSSHEAHISSLADAHAAEIASLRNYAKLLEEQLAQRQRLHHASSNNPLFILDTSESPSTPNHESSQHTTGTTLRSTISSRTVPEKQQQSPVQPQYSPEMESLKRKLSTTRRPQTADRNLLPELNQYKQNNVALQTQIGSLMAKLNESKKTEKALRASLKDVEQKCTEAESKAREARQLMPSVQALQNTIDHLESRLEIANTEKLDAQEEIFNMRALKSPFDAQFPELQMSMQDAHDSMDTVFSNDSHAGRHRDSSDPANLSAFVARIEQLQDEIAQKDVYISGLEGDSTQLRQMLDRVNQQCDEINLQLDIQNELLGKTKDTDAHIEQLRTAILEREAVIGEKERSVRVVERQLEHHKLLLQAEIRKHATTSRYLASENDPLPELTALATKKDIDRWIQKLNERLKKEKPMSPAKEPMTAVNAQTEDLRNEIDFYIREIIYYKLDIRGYKSDIKKLKKITAQLGNYGSRASDLDSDTSSLRPAPTPIHTRFLSTTPELRSSGHPSPAFTGFSSTNVDAARALTPPPSRSADSPNDSPPQKEKELQNKHVNSANSRVPMTPETPTQSKAIKSRHATSVTTQQSMDDSTLHLYGTPRMSGNPTASPYDDHTAMFAHTTSIEEQMPFEKGNKPNESRVISAHASASSAHESATDFTLSEISGIGRPQPERGVSDASTVRPVVPASKFSKDLASPPSPKPHQTSHSRTGSGSSATSYKLQSQSSSRPERKLSAASSTDIPFVVAMGSPNNPAIAVAAKNMPPTRHAAPHKPSSTTSRAGVGGTMASFTPLSSPTCVENSSPLPAKSATGTTGNERKLSLTFRRSEIGSPTTPTHTRSLSGGSIRTAIRWTKNNGRDKENNLQLRKDSIDIPKPLGSPIRIERDIEGMADETKAIDFAVVRGTETRST